MISITDGQIYLVDDLFKSGVRPAVDVGISVSRVGGDAQIKAMKSVAGTLKLDLAQFRELEAFATFGSELDRVSQAQLDRGYRLTELLKQPLNAPMPVEEQVISIFAGTNGYLDDLPVEDVRRFESELLELFRTRHAELLATIRDTGQLPDEAELKQAVDDFKATFQPSGGAEGDTTIAALKARPSASPSPTRPWRRSDRGIEVRGIWPVVRSASSATHPERAVDQEDHARDGAHRGQPHRAGAGAGRGRGAVQRPDHRGRP